MENILNNVAKGAVPPQWQLIDCTPSISLDGRIWTCHYFQLRKRPKDGYNAGSDDGPVYSLIVEFNQDIPDAVENPLMDALYVSADLEADEVFSDREALKAASRAILCFLFAHEHLWVGEPPELVSSDDGDYPPRLLVRRTLCSTSSGVVEAVPHSLPVQDPAVVNQTGPIPNPCPGVPVVRPSQLVRLRGLGSRCDGVRVVADGSGGVGSGGCGGGGGGGGRSGGDGGGGDGDGDGGGARELVHKTYPAHWTTDWLQNEVGKLSKLDHPAVVKLAAVVVVAEDPAGPVASILLHHVPGKSLVDVTAATAEQKRTWTAQLRDALAHIHSRGCVWGDAKPHNIIVHESSGALVLIDFEGGHTPPWVTWRTSDSKEGDAQGAHAIELFIHALPTLRPDV